MQSGTKLLLVLAGLVLVIGVGVILATGNGNGNDSVALPGPNNGVDTGDDNGREGDDNGVSGGTQAAEADDGTGEEDEDRYRVQSQAVVSAHEIATQAGITVLERGGSAADAAVAVAAALSVVEPWFSSVFGGGTWALYYDAETGEVVSLDGVGPTGSLASVDDFAQRAGDSGMHQANVPGAWDGWMIWLERFGRLDLGDVLEPAIRAGREGYVIGSEMADWLGRSEILSQPATAAIYAPDGIVLGVGDTVYQNEMADTFEAVIAAYNEELDNGRVDAFQAAREYYYRGPLAEAIVRASDELGGYLTLEDFHGFEAQLVRPISIEYDDELTVYQNPPNSQGITMLLALNILKGYDFSTLELGEAIHLHIEAMKLAFADRHHHVGDPERIDVPVESLLSDEHAQRQRERIDPSGAISWPVEDSLASARISRDVGDTTTFHVIDRDGNAAAVTTSLGAQFFVIEGTGIHINNRMRFLALDDGDPNQLTPGFKVRHTSNPYMVLKDGRPFILGGNTGVDTQPQGQLQQFINIVEYGFSAQEAVDTPRWVTNSFPAATYPYNATNVLELEDGFNQGLRQRLEALGHTVQSGGLTGNANVIVIADDGAVDVGADPRNGTSAGMLLPP